MYLCRPICRYNEFGVITNVVIKRVHCTILSSYYSKQERKRKERNKQTNKERNKQIKKKKRKPATLLVIVSMTIYCINFLVLSLFPFKFKVVFCG